ncbi:nuclear transport factor 2 family protein [Burkholderia sp. Ac-20353]|uniref:aromatic-ring-hydroxylating dioxygenase subunit beta n=1 Tax=Burkholderia sp. Ac-20353 TaxID=2703894 RepID=UPI00197C9075|nr:nuclear transport factor 2 family protein [Burkholderia sp. Ac-20353]MBN3785603.1 salicylate hydroxylase [Burkholderia sp. Ac-20353]
MLDFETYQQVLALYADYASVVDNNEWDKWPEFFTDACTYKIQPRENFDRGFPLATLAFESKGMLKDRVYGMTETIFHDPYYQRHVVGAPRILRADSERIDAEANYAVFRTKPDELTTVFNVGRYVDTIRRTRDGLRFESRICVFDSEMIANSIIYPI